MENNWLEDLNKLNSILDKNGLENLKQQIFENSLAGGTGGEILLIVDKILIEVKKTNPEIYYKIKNEAENIHKHKVKYLGK